MFCRKCGKQIPDGVFVCGYCGTPVEQNPNGNGSQQGSRQNVYGESAPSYSGQSVNPSYGQNPGYGYQPNPSYSSNQGYGAPQNQPYGPNSGYGTPQNMDGGATGMGIASMVLGICSLIFACCVGIWWLTIILAALSILFGILSLQKGNQAKGMSIAGIVCSCVSVVFVIMILILGMATLAAFFSALTISIRGISWMYL